MKILLLSLLFVYSNPCLQADIVIVADFSGSVQGYENQIKRSLLSFVNRFELSEETAKIGVITFADYAVINQGLTTDKTQLTSAIHKVYHPQGSTNTVDALQYAANELIVNGRPGFRKVIVFISDGRPDSPCVALQIANQLKTFDIRIYGILITAPDHDEEFMRVASSVYLKTDYESLSDEIMKLNVCL